MQTFGYNELDIYILKLGHLFKKDVSCVMSYILFFCVSTYIDTNLHTCVHNRFKSGEDLGLIIFSILYLLVSGWHQIITTHSEVKKCNNRKPNDCVI